MGQQLWGPSLALPPRALLFGAVKPSRTGSSCWLNPQLHGASPAPLIRQIFIRGFSQDNYVMGIVLEACKNGFGCGKVRMWDRVNYDLWQGLIQPLKLMLYDKEWTAPVCFNVGKSFWLSKVDAESIVIAMGFLGLGYINKFKNQVAYKCSCLE